MDSFFKETIYHEEGPFPLILCTLKVIEPYQGTTEVSHLYLYLCQEDLCYY